MRVRNPNARAVWCIKYNNNNNKHKHNTYSNKKKNNITNQSHDAHQAYLEFYRPAVHIMRTLNEEGKLTDLQQKFFS